MDINLFEVIGRQQVDIYILQSRNAALAAELDALRERVGDETPAEAPDRG